MTNLNRKLMITRKPRWDTVVVLLFFAAFFLYGCLVFQDYGISVDEMTQRGHSLINYKYLVPSVSDIKTFAVDFPAMGNLEDSQSFYGVAIQLPLVLAEHLTGFTMPFKTMFLMRHFYTFFLFFLSAVCFYKCCRLFTENRLLALLGTAVYILNPRTLADSFYNIKDLVGLSLCMMTIYFGCKMLREMKQRHLIFFAFFGALGTNSRIVLAVVIAAFLFAAFLQGISQGEWKKRFFLCLEAGILSLVFYFIMTPGIWANTLQNVQETVETFSNYTDMPGTSVYNGSTVTGDDLSRSYIFVWMAITIPVVYLLYAAAGMIRNLRQMIHMAVKRKKWSWIQYVWLALFLTMAIPFAYVLIVNPVVYNGWRHFYFLYSVIALGAFFGLLACEELFRSRKKLVWAGRGVLAAGIVGVMVWIGINHPYEYVFFNIFARSNVENNYDRDYWGMSTYQALQYICEIDDSPELNIYAYNGFSKLFLSDEDWDRVFFVENMEDADYIIENYQKGADTGLYEQYYYYDRIHDFTVDGFSVCTIYKKVYNPYYTGSMYQDKASGQLMYSINDQEVEWTWQADGDMVTYTGEYREAMAADAFYLDTSWEEAAAGMEIWLSEDGESWLCVTDLEGTSHGQYAVQALLPETINVKYIRFSHPSLSYAPGQEDGEDYASLHIQLYRSAEEEAEVPEAVSPIERVAGHENPLLSMDALDKNSYTRWETENSQQAGQAYDIVLNNLYEISGVRLEYGVDGEDYPRQLRVFLSADNETWTEAVVYTEDNIEYYFENTSCRYIRLMTGDPGEELECKWAIAELELLAGARQE